MCFILFPSEVIFEDLSRSESSSIAFHKRLGLTKDDYNGGFKPVLIKGGIDVHPSYQWLLLARSIRTNKSQYIQIVALPSLMYCPDECEMIRPKHHLVGFIKIPHEYILKALNFYGDDGNSSLSSFHVEKGEEVTFKDEGKQTLLMIVETKAENANEELWSVDYDSV